MVYIAGCFKVSCAVSVSSWPSRGWFQSSIKGGSSSKVTHIDVFIDVLHEMTAASSRMSFPERQRVPNREASVSYNLILEIPIKCAVFYL